MTIAIAQRRGDDILLVADTKVSNEPKPRPDELPGRLKVVTFAERMTAAFAGYDGPATVAIRNARQVFRRDGPAAALGVLVASSREKTDDGKSKAEFLVAAHHGETALWRIKNGVRLPVEGDVCAIGAEGPFTDLIERARAETSGSLWKGHLRTRFVDVIMTGKHGVPSIGGFPIAVRASPEGHKYLGHTGGYTYKFPPLWGRVTVQPIEQVYCGDGHFQLTIAPSKNIDVPVVGACLVQARHGYVYSPIERPEPYTVDLLPGEIIWEGREREMYTALDAAIAEHVAAVASL